MHIANSILQECVPFVASHENLADFFTKPLIPKTFFALRNRIMNVPDPFSSNGGALSGGPLSPGSEGEPKLVRVP